MLIALLEPTLELTALAAAKVRAAGNVPLIADPRWSAEFWAAQVARFDGQETDPTAAWAAFSGGSTGNPRVILRTHESWQASFDPLNQLLALTPQDVFYLPGSTASSMTLFSLAHVQQLGAKISVGKSQETKGAELATATVFHGTATALATVLNLLERGATSQLRAALVGGEAMSPRLRDRAEALGIQVISYYGAAELSFVAFDPDGTGLRPFPGVELEIRDGILWSRSAYQSLGYQSLGYGGDTAGAFERDSHEWATVGDLALEESIAVDGEQELRITILGRSDGAILTAGATVIPEEVEAQLNQIDSIAGSVVFGLPNETTGSLVAVLIERSDFQPAPDLAQIKAQVSLLLSNTHQPRIWFETDQIPRTAAGKIARNVVAELAARKELRRLE